MVSATPTGTAIVIGGSAGIGLAIAAEYARRGYAVVIVARDAGRLVAARAAIEARYASSHVRTIVLDACAPEAPSRLVTLLAETGAGPRHVVHVAAVWHDRSIAETSTAEMQRLFAANVIAPVSICRELLARMRPGDGLLVIGSLAGSLPLPWMSLYSASKASLASAVLALRQEMHGSGIAISLLAPGAVLTDFVPRREDARWRWMVDLVASAPETVARAGCSGLATGRAIIVPGILWRLGWLGMRLLPSRLLAAITRRVLSPMAPAPVSLAPAPLSPDSELPAVASKPSATPSDAAHGGAGAPASAPSRAE